jgi:hypothetical protein
MYEKYPISSDYPSAILPGFMNGLMQPFDLILMTPFLW